MYNKTSTYKLQKQKKNLLLHLGTSCLETSSAIIPQINNKLYSVPNIFVMKIKKD